MKEKSVFGEWLAAPIRGIALRLVIEEMSAAAAVPSAAAARLRVASKENPTVEFSSGRPGWPWVGDADDRFPTIAWKAASEMEFQSLEIDQTSETEWIRRYRMEATSDGRSWRVATPSRLIDSFHQQPCSLQNYLETLESSILPAGRGTRWAASFWEDYMTRAITPLAKDSPYPDWLAGPYFLSAAVAPFYYGGAYNAGDCANFDAIIASVFSPETAVNCQRLFPSVVDHFGFMPGSMNPGRKDDRAFNADISQTSWGPVGYWDVFSWSRDRDYLGWFGDACATWARWWLANRDSNNDGWLEPGLNGCKPSTPEFREEQAKANPKLAALCPEFWDYVGLQHPEFSAFQHSMWEIPWDDTPIFVRGRHRGIKFNPETCSVNIHFIETQLYISLLAQFAGFALEATGRGEEAGFLKEQSRRLRGLVADNCWDEDSGFYYDRDADTGRLRTFAKHLGAFVPMMLGIPSLEQAGRIVEHLTNPREFWTDYPAPVISRDTPDYSPNGFWSGMTWPSTNYFVLRALLNYGFFEIADEFLRRWIAHAGTCVDRSVAYIDLENAPGQPPHDLRYARVSDIEWIVPECWNSETGAVYGNSGGITWGGMWLPAVLMRHFWPVGERGALVRPGGYFRFRWGDRWEVDIEDGKARVNGRTFTLAERATYLIDDDSGSITPLEPGKADPTLLMT